MKSFFIQTLGCKVNQYESEQLAALLRARGLVPAQRDLADLCIINTCAVTTEATSKSRQIARRAARLRILQPAGASAAETVEPSTVIAALTRPSRPAEATRPRVVVTGCWATSDPASAGSIPGVDAVIGHHDVVADALGALLDTWMQPPRRPGAIPVAGSTGDDSGDRGTKQAGDDGWISTGERNGHHVTYPNKSQPVPPVKQNPASFGGLRRSSQPPESGPAGTVTLPQLDGHWSGHARAFLKVQDGCDAHCTYCIIPALRPALWSKPVEAAVREARTLIEAGHREIVLTGIFLGAYGHATALRRRQGAADGTGAAARLGELASALCTEVPGLKRLRFSSLEPMDLTDELIAVLRDLPQVVPHFHLPLQSGSNRLLRRMNRQYRRDDFLRMLDRVFAAFDRPALTTDIICGFPGETDDDFEQTLDIVDRARFIHIHAFPFSPRPGTAAARWTGEFIPSALASQRIEDLRARALDHSFNFRQRFIGQTVELLVERPDHTAEELNLHHGRCERYFDVHFSAPDVQWGDLVRVRIERITRTRTFGTMVV